MHSNFLVFQTLTRKIIFTCNLHVVRTNNDEWKSLEYNFTAIAFDFKFLIYGNAVSIQKKLRSGEIELLRFKITIWFQSLNVK